jgi:uncharacterized protein
MRRFITSLSLLLVLGAGAAAQPNPFGDLLGGMIGAAMVENARREWSQMSGAERACLEIGLRRNGTSADRLVRQGIGPSDARLNNLRNVCIQLLGRELSADLDCTLTPPGGRPYATRCREVFARFDNRGNPMPISLEEAMEDAFAGRRPDVSRFERPDAANRRREQIAAGADASRVVAPSWSCEKGKKPSEVAICNSYELTLYDNQYSDLWARARPLDPKGDVARQLAANNRNRDACNASVSCIRDTTEKGIVIIADFLRSKGQTVVTLADDAAERRKREAEEQARRDEIAKARAEQLKAEAEAAKETARQRAEQAKAEAEAAREAARVRAEQAKAEAEAARETARLKAEAMQAEARRRQEEAQKREAEAAEYAARLREAVDSRRAARISDLLVFPPPQKEDLTEEEAALPAGPCGSAIRGQDQLLAAHRLAQTAKSDVVRRSCKVEMGNFELSSGRREEGLAWLAAGLTGAEHSSGSMFAAWIRVARDLRETGKASESDVCAAVEKADAAFAARPTRLRDGKTMIVAGVPAAAAVGLGCDKGVPVRALLRRQTALCGIDAPKGPLEAFSEQARNTCWVNPTAFAELRGRTGARLAAETKEVFEEQRLEKAVTASSAERRAFAEKYDECRVAVENYAGRTPGDLRAAIGKVDAACREFLKP